MLYCGVPETLQDIVASVRADVARNGSLATHVNHEWDRTGLGVWCADCEVWVIPTPVGVDFVD